VPWSATAEEVPEPAEDQMDVVTPRCLHFVHVASMVGADLDATSVGQLLLGRSRLRAVPPIAFCFESQPPRG